MKANVSARGFTNVMLVLNMKRFVREADQARFERIRGREEFAQTLREIWPQKLDAQDKFITLEEDKRRYGRPDRMSTEQVGFAIGVFRSLMLEKYAFPAYALDKEKVEFSNALMTNFQFKTLFWKQWSKWHIYIRPTHTGFFVIRLTYRYLNQSRSFIKLAQDIIRLQESLDIRSAQNWLQEARQKYNNDFDTLLEKEKSVQAFLQWLGVDESYTGDALYYPVQWRIAMEACSQFVKAIGSEIFINEEESIHLEIPKPSVSIPLYDSYVVHHFDELMASGELVKRTRLKQSNRNSQIVLELNDVRESPQIRQTLVNLLEGTILKISDIVYPLETQDEETTSFPKHGWKIVDEVLNGNQATWFDELCLMSSKTTVVWPSRKWHEHELLVSSVPGATYQVVYHRFWDSIERAIEFIIEIVALVNEIESLSYSLLIPISNAFDKSVAEKKVLVTSRAIISELISSSVHLRHQARLCQEMSNPRLWSRSENWISSFSNLLNQFDVSSSLRNIGSNLDSLSDYLDLYLAEVTESETRKIDLRSIALAAASLTLTLLMLPSFYVDAWQLAQNLQTKYILLINVMVIIGTILACGLLGTAIFILIRPWLNKD